MSTDLHVIFTTPSTVYKDFRLVQGGSSLSRWYRGRTGTDANGNAWAQYCGFLYLMRQTSNHRGFFDYTGSNTTSTLVETVDGVSHYVEKLSSNQTCSDTWWTNHFPTDPCPIVSGFDTPFTLPWNVQNNTLVGVTMPAIDTTSTTGIVDALGDIPASVNLSSGMTAGSVATTTNVTGTWIIDNYGDGTITLEDFTESSQLRKIGATVEKLGTIQCGITAHFEVSPVITEIHKYYDSTNTLTNVTYTTGAVTIRTCRFSALTRSMTIPW